MSFDIDVFLRVRAPSHSPEGREDFCTINEKANTITLKDPYQHTNQSYTYAFKKIFNKQSQVKQLKVTS